MFEAGQLWIEGVNKGNYADMKNSEEVETIDGLSGKENVNLFGFHFHPDEEGIILPSGGDLSAQGDRDARRNGLYYTHPYIGVGHISVKGDVTMLIVQAPPNSVSPAELAEYEKECSVVNSQKEHQELLQSLGYRSVLVRFKKNQGSFDLSSQSEDSLLQGFDTVRVGFIDPED